MHKLLFLLKGLKANMRFWREKNGIDIAWNNDQHVKLVKLLMTENDTIQLFAQLMNSGDTTWLKHIQLGEAWEIFRIDSGIVYGIETYQTHLKYEQV